jgi:hypothetical protein
VHLAGDVGGRRQSGTEAARRPAVEADDARRVDVERGREERDPAADAEADGVDLATPPPSAERRCAAAARMSAASPSQVSRITWGW